MYRLEETGKLRHDRLNANFNTQNNNINSNSSSISRLQSTIMNALSNVIPTGIILPFAGNIELEGWSICDGGELNRTTYSKLFSVIGTTYGAGNGSTTFNKPNFINRTIWGATTAGAIKEAGLPNIKGSLKIYHVSISEVQEAISAQSFRTDIGAGSVNGYYGSTVTFDASLSNPIYGNSETVQPPAISVRMMIKL